MIRTNIVILSLLLWLDASGSTDYSSLVNPLMGTQSSFELSAGNTYPAIGRPWGMNFWTPQTGTMGNGWIYTYNSNKIRGFKQTHQPSPWINDYGQFSIMPTTGLRVFDENQRASWFSHKAETALPHYYKVYLADHDVSVEMSPTDRAAVFRFTFPETDSANIVIDAFDKGSSIKIDVDKQTITGYSTKNSGGVPDNFKNYFVIEFDKPFAAHATVSDGIITDGNIEADCNHSGAIVSFKTKRGEQIHARIASSFISNRQALLNLNELAGMSFDSLVNNGKESWNRELGKIKIEGNDINKIKTFYTCLYRSLLFPRKFHEIADDGTLHHYSPHNGKICNGFLYTDTGLWDTFRSLFPLLNFLYPEINREIQEGMLNHYRESGFFPEWASPGHRDCMIGNNSASVLADAYLNGVEVQDTAALWNGIVNGTTAVHPEISSTGRIGHEYYNLLGYVPCDCGINESAARTLEYAYNDWCIYQLGKKLNRPSYEIEIYSKRAMNYRNLFDKESKLMRGRLRDGTFHSPFSPFKWGGDFTEGNSWHYTWSVFHDPQGLIDLMGGRQEFVAMLDSVFNVPPIYDDSYYGFPIHEIREMTVMNMGNYAHGNQPAQHMIYLYAYAGKPWKSQYWLRKVMDSMYSCTPDGYCGDEDNGQTSAWFVFSALGFYPVCPGSGEFVAGTPLFPKATIKFDNGKTLIINADKISDKNFYIDTVKFNGHKYNKNYFNRSDLLNGGIIELKMNDTPNIKRGTDKSAFPYSFSQRLTDSHLKIR